MKNAIILLCVFLFGCINLNGINSQGRPKFREGGDIIVDQGPTVEESDLCNRWQINKCIRFCQNRGMDFKRCNKKFGRVRCVCEAFLY